MANPCYTTMHVYGPKAEVERFYALVSSEPSMHDLFASVGFTKAQIDALDAYGWWQDKPCVCETPDGLAYCKVYYETKWSNNIAAWDALLERAFPELEQVSSCEGEEYVNTDWFGLFFEERYYVDGTLCNHYTSEMENPYVATKEEALGLINEMARKAGVPEFKTIEEAEEFFDDDENNPDPDADFFLNVHEYATNA